MRVGNDVVDLRTADNQPAAIHPRFDARVFGPAERILLADAPGEIHRHRLRWTLWAAKESACKLARKSNPELPFHPREFRVHLEPDLATGTVAFDDESVQIVVDIDGQRVHCVATDRVDSNIVADATRIDPGVSADVAVKIGRERAERAIEQLLAMRPTASEPVRVVGGSGHAGFRRIPCACKGDRVLPVDLSLSHDGEWVAYALVPSTGTC